MIEAVRDLQGYLQELDKALRQLRAQRVDKRQIRNKAKAVVDHYFRSTREAALRTGVRESELAGCDGSMHALLECTHRRSTAASYRGHVKDLLRHLMALEKVGLLAGKNASPVHIEPRDGRIISTLGQLIPSAALSYEQAVLDLEQTSRLSWRGPAADLREALRETLDHLAPDGEVAAQSGFRPEPNTTGPTMKQKVRYILSRRSIPRSSMQAPETAVEAVEAAVGSFVRSVYSRSNLSTHTPTDKSEVLRVLDLVRVSLCELLEIR